MSNIAQQLSPRQIMAQGLAKRRGISPEEAEAVLATVLRQDEENGVRTFMQAVGDNAAILKQLPPEAQQTAMQYMAGASTRPPGDDMAELKKMMREVTVIRETLREQPSGQPNEALLKQMDDMRKALDTMKEEQAAKRFEEFSTKMGDRLAALETDLKESLEAAGAKPGDGGEVNPIVKAVEDIRALNEAQASLKEALGVKEAAPTLSVAEEIESIKKLGYKVEGPKTLDQIEKEIDERIKGAIETTKKETLAQVKSDEKKMAMLIDLGTAVIDGLMPAVAEEFQQSALKTAKNALKAASEGT